MSPIYDDRLWRNHLLATIRIVSVFSVATLLILTRITTFAAPQTVLNPQSYLDESEFVPRFPAQAAPTTTGGNITGLVWTDLNRNGTLDELEPMAAEQTVFLTPDIESDFAQILVLTTDQQGQFQAGDLEPGHYRIWAASQSAAEALIVLVTDDRAIMTVQLPLAAHVLYIPDIRG